jgi:hypothetical protein
MEGGADEKKCRVDIRAAVDDSPLQVYELGLLIPEDGWWKATIESELEPYERGESLRD